MRMRSRQAAMARKNPMVDFLAGTEKYTHLPRIGAKHGPVNGFQYGITYAFQTLMRPPARMRAALRTTGSVSRLAISAARPSHAQIR